MRAIGHDERWHPWQVDVADEDSVTREFTRIVQQVGALHGLFNNAGVLSPNDVPTRTPDEFDRIFGVNVRGMYLCCRAVIPAMIKGAGIDHQYRIDQLHLGRP